MGHRLEAGSLDGLAATITDEVLDNFAIIGTWGEVTDRVSGRSGGVAERVISRLTHEDIVRRPTTSGGGTRIATAVVAAGDRVFSDG